MLDTQSSQHHLTFPSVKTDELPSLGSRASFDLFPFCTIPRHGCAEASRGDRRHVTVEEGSGVE